MKSENPLFIVIFFFSVMVGLVIDKRECVAGNAASTGATSPGAASPPPASTGATSPTPASSGAASSAPASSAPVSTGVASPGQSEKVENGLWTEVVSHRKIDSKVKVTIIGAGAVGTAVAFGLMTQMVTDEIVLLGKDENKVKGEVKDLQDGSGFVKSPRISGGTLEKDSKLARNSRVIIITAGANFNTQGSGPGGKVTKEELAEKNLKILQDIIPKVEVESPDAVYIIVTNPVDIMAYAAWKILGSQSTYQIIGAGTNLDSQRMRVLIAEDLHVAPESVGGWIIGEQGENSVIAWSGVNIAGNKLKDIKDLSNDIEKITESYVNGEDWFKRIKNNVMNRAKNDKTIWAVSLSVTNIVYSIIHNTPNVHAVSTLAQGFHGISEDVFMSLPCILGDTGVTHIIKQNLDPEEVKKLTETATKMKEIIVNLKIDKISPSNSGGASAGSGGTAANTGNAAATTGNAAATTGNAAATTGNAAATTGNAAATTGNAAVNTGSPATNAGSPATNAVSPATNAVSPANNAGAPPSPGGAKQGTPAKTASTTGGATNAAGGAANAAGGATNANAGSKTT